MEKNSKRKSQKRTTSHSFKSLFFLSIFVIQFEPFRLSVCLVHGFACKTPPHRPATKGINTKDCSTVKGVSIFFIQEIPKALYTSLPHTAPTGLAVSRCVSHLCGRSYIPHFLAQFGSLAPS